MGIHPKEFYKLTLYEYRLLFHQHLFKESKAFEHTRIVQYTLFCVNSTDKKKPSIQEFFPLLTDNYSKEKEVAPMSVDDRQKMQQDALKRIQMLKNK